MTAALLSGVPPLALPQLGLRNTLRLALVSLVVLFGILGLWSALTMISGAVVAQGQVMVKAQTQQLQSLEGGTVSALLVHNGDRVAKGQILVQFDPSLTEASLDIALAKLADALTLQARLQAEQQGTPFDVTPPSLPFPAPDLTVAAAGQRSVFAARAALLQGQRDRLVQTLAQQDSQMQGLKTQISAKRDQIALAQTQVTNQQSLLDKGLTRQSALSDLRRGLSELLGQLAGLEAEEARLTNARADSTLETLQGERSFQEKVATDLGDATARVQELVLEIVTRRAQLAHLDLRAPMEGVVHEMKLATIGGVVAPGGTVLDIIPLDQGLSFEVQVDPRGIDQVHPGQEADLVLSSFDPRSTPRLKAQVRAVSPDAVLDPRSGHSFYRVELDVPARELARLGDQLLMPGMPISAYLTTSDRSVLAYLLHPLTSQMDLAFRED